MEQRYEILENHELLYYEKKKKIFESYVSKFYCLKTQYSGISNGENVEYHKKRLSKQLLNDFGILVRWEDIPTDKNEAMRFVMKLILNSLWSKLCQNFNKSFVYFVTDSEELYAHVSDKRYESAYFDVMDTRTARIICSCHE